MWMYIVAAVILLVVVKRALRPKQFDFSKPHTFFVTGCASGIAKRLTEQLLARGQTVVATDVNIEQLEKNAHEWRQQYKLNPNQLATKKVDITSYDMYEQVYQEIVQQYGTIDVHMNVAGYLKPGYVIDFDAREIDRHMDINVKGLIFGTKLAAKHMTEKQKGHIVNIGSLASLTPFHGCSLYGASKYAVRSFSLAAASELREKGVKVSLLCPDAVQTPMLDLQVAYEEASLTFSGSRFLTTDDVVNEVLDVILQYQPMEHSLPFVRGLLCRFSDLIYGTTVWSLLNNVVVKLGSYQRKKYGKQK